MHLRDDRKLVGVLRSYDQYGSSMLLPAFSRWLSRLFFPDERSLLAPLPPSRPGRVVPRAANLVLTQTVERLFHPASKSYAQTDRGVFLVRGENVVLLGEVVSSPPPSCIKPLDEGEERERGVSVLKLNRRAVLFFLPFVRRLFVFRTSTSKTRRWQT